MATNPLIGASWGGANGQNPNPINLNTNPGGGIQWNPGNFSNPKGPNEINRNMGISNIQTNQIKNALAPQFAKAFGQYGGAAGDFFSQLTNLGSPFYKQKQAEAFNQGVQQNQNAAGQAKQQLDAQGYGYTPSGANAAMIGGMATAGAQDLSEQYLQNLFQNEQLQLAGAQGEAGIAQMFNPTQLLGGTSVGANVQAQPTFFQDLNQVLSSLSGAGGSSGPAGTAVSL